MAVRYSNLEGLQLLVQAGADPSCTGEEGYTALHNATRCGQTAMAQALLKHPSVASFVNIRTIDGNTALHFIAPLQLLQHLLACPGIDVDARDGNDATPLLVAVMLSTEGYYDRAVERITVLVRKGKASIGLADREGVTALHVAADGCLLARGVLKALLDLAEEQGEDLSTIIHLRPRAGRRTRSPYEEARCRYPEQAQRMAAMAAARSRGPAAGAEGGEGGE